MPVPGQLAGFNFHRLATDSRFPLHLWGQVCPGALPAHFRSLDVKSPFVLFCKGLIFQFSDYDDDPSPILSLLYTIVEVSDRSFSCLF